MAGAGFSFLAAFTVAVRTASAGTLLRVALAVRLAVALAGLAGLASMATAGAAFFAALLFFVGHDSISFA